MIEKTKTKTAILKTLFKEPFREYTTIELKDMAKVNYERVYTITKELAKEGVIILKSYKKQKIIKVNLESDLLRKYFEIFEIKNKEKFAKKEPVFFKIIDDFAEVLKGVPQIRSVVLFGSVARGRATRTSDIDILILTDSNLTMQAKNKIHKIQQDVSKRQFSKFESIILSNSEFLDNFNKMEFYTYLWQDRILFRGYENFWELVADAKE